MALRTLKGWRYARPTLGQIASYRDITVAELQAENDPAELDKAVFRMSKRGRPPKDEHRQAVPARFLPDALRAGRHLRHPHLKLILRGGRAVWGRVRVIDNLVDILTDEDQIVWSCRF